MQHFVSFDTGRVRDQDKQIIYAMLADDECACSNGTSIWFYDSDLKIFGNIFDVGSLTAKIVMHAYDSMWYQEVEYDDENVAALVEHFQD